MLGGAWWWLLCADVVVPAASSEENRHAGIAAPQPARYRCVARDETDVARHSGCVGQSDFSNH